MMFQNLLQNKGLVNCKSKVTKRLPLSSHGSLNIAFPVFLLAGAAGLDAESAVTVEGNTSFVGNSAGGDGDEYRLVNVRLCYSCNVWLCVVLEQEGGFRYSSTQRQTRQRVIRYPGRCYQ